MRKKFFIIIFIFSLLLVMLGGCATFEKADLSGLRVVAVVSVVADRKIDMSDFKGLGAMVSKLSQSKDFKLDDVVNQIRNDVFEEYAPYLPFELMKERDVLNNEIYRNFYNEMGIDAKRLSYTTPKGYQIILMNKKNHAKLFEAFPEAGGLMYLRADYKLSKTKGGLLGGEAKVLSRYHITVVDRTGKKVLERTNWAVSDGIIKFAFGGIMDAKQIMPLVIMSSAKAAETTKNWIQREMGE